MERRERLRRLLAEREATGEGVDGAPLVGQVLVEEVVEQKELFYTGGWAWGPGRRAQGARLFVVHRWGGGGMPLCMWPSAVWCW